MLDVGAFAFLGAGCRGSDLEVDYPAMRALMRAATILSFLVLLAVAAVGAEGEAVQAPEDVAGPTGSFEMTKSGIASKVLRKGSGTGHPKKRSKVTVNYSGWTTDGRLFDSTITRGRPATFRLWQD